MHIRLALFLLLCLASLADGALPPGFEDELYCPPKTCLGARERPTGFTGPRAMFHQCVDIESSQSLATPRAYGFKVDPSVKEELLQHSWHTTPCPPGMEMPNRRVSGPSHTAGDVGSRGAAPGRGASSGHGSRRSSPSSDTAPAPKAGLDPQHMNAAHIQDDIKERKERKERRAKEYEEKVERRGKQREKFQRDHEPAELQRRRAEDMARRRAHVLETKGENYVRESERRAMADDAPTGSDSTAGAEAPAESKDSFDSIVETLKARRETVAVPKEEREEVLATRKDHSEKMDAAMEKLKQMHPEIHQRIMEQRRAIKMEI